jgi:competence protein ComEC
VILLRVVEDGSFWEIAALLGGSEVLGPEVADPSGAADVNNGSLVVRWEQGGMRVLLTGDLETEGELRLVRGGSDLRAELLKVPHHGSRSATGFELLRAVQPRAGLISCGRDNRFGHPHRETLERLERGQVPVYRTDHGGLLTARLEGGELRTEAFVHEDALDRALGLPGPGFPVRRSGP